MFFFSKKITLLRGIFKNCIDNQILVKVIAREKNPSQIAQKVAHYWPGVLFSTRKSSFIIRRVSYFSKKSTSVKVAYMITTTWHRSWEIAGVISPRTTLEYHLARCTLLPTGSEIKPIPTFANAVSHCAIPTRGTKKRVRQNGKP